MAGSSTKVSVNSAALAALRATQRRLALEWGVAEADVTVSAAVLHLSGRRPAGPEGRISEPPAK